MLTRRTAFIALLYTEDDDPRVSMDQASYGVQPGGEYNLLATVTTVVTSLEAIDATWQKKSGDDWGVVVDDAGGDAPYEVGDHTAAPGISVDATSEAFSSGDKIYFTNGGVLELSASASSSATTLYGTLSDATIVEDEAGHRWADAPTTTGYSASFVTTASGARSGVTQYTIDSLVAGDLGDYRVVVTGGITDPYYSANTILEIRTSY